MAAVHAAGDYRRLLLLGENQSGLWVIYLFLGICSLCRQAFQQMPSLHCTLLA